MSKLKSIINGWANLAIDGNKEIAEKRAKICAKCDFNIANICSKCICPLPAKTRSKYESCELWPEELNYPTCV